MRVLTICDATYEELIDKYKNGTTVVLAIDRNKETEWEYKGHKGDGYKPEIALSSEPEETKDNLLKRFEKEKHDESKEYFVYTLGQEMCVANIIPM